MLCHTCSLLHKFPRNPSMLLSFDTVGGTSKGELIGIPPQLWLKVLQRTLHLFTGQGVSWKFIDSILLRRWREWMTTENDKQFPNAPWWSTVMPQDLKCSPVYSFPQYPPTTTAEYPRGRREEPYIAMPSDVKPFLSRPCPPCPNSLCSARRDWEKR